ncbi:MAG: hypothetical protein M0P13_09125 [Fibrobacteraceae bacterium]|nr:hypothetical protein [Fibrobacteraceae bacterium]
MIMDKSLAFFDVDSLEYFAQQSDRRSVLPHLSFRERVSPLAPVLNGLYAYAISCGHPLVFSTCCSGRAPAENEVPEILHIPALDAGVCWKEKSRDYSFFLMEKFLDIPPELPFMEKMRAKFMKNQNFRRFAQAMNVEEWVTFGNGAAFCVYSALQSLLNAGQKVILLSDVLVDSHSGHTPEETTALREQMFEASAKQGVEVCTLEEFCKRKGIATGSRKFHRYSGNLIPLLEAKKA